MRMNILIGGKAGQGINKVSEVISSLLVNYGYFIFNYRDYQSLIRGGHNFNVLSISDKRVGSFESEIDILICLDDKTFDIHKKNLKKQGFVVKASELKEELGRNLNIAMAGVLCKILGIDKEELIKEIKKDLDIKQVIDAGEYGYDFAEEKFNLEKLKNNIKIMSGSSGISQGFIDSGGELYFAYPMTPATGVLHELGMRQVKEKFRVFLPENEIAVVNMALGSSFAGKKVMIGTAGGGFDLMTEGLSLQGMSEIPLVVYLASRPGPSTGIPTYSLQDDLDVALRGGHGEFPRVVIAPGDPIECIEKTNEAFYLSEKFGALSIILSDKHLAESQFSFDNFPHKPLKINIERDLPGEKIVKALSYEHDRFGNTTEVPEIAKENADLRLEKYGKIKKEILSKKFEMIKIFGNKNSKNLVIGWGSNKSVILDAIEDLDIKFLQVLYMKPMSEKIREEIEKSKNVIIVESNVTGQLGRLIREKTGIKIEKRILKYDTRPFTSDELRQEIIGKLK